MPKTALRITSGEFKGRAISAPASAPTHPMGSREKLALFNTLISLTSPETPKNAPLAGFSTVLDCYCGSGALGLEALSRGAKKAVFVDNNVSALQAVKDNISALGLLDRAEVIKTDTTAISSTSATWQKYDLILVDPPYDKFPPTLDGLADMLNPNGILVLSHPGSVDEKQYFANLELLTTKSYASAHLSFYRLAC